MTSSQRSQITDLNALDDAGGARLEVDQLIHIFVEPSVGAEAAALVQPVEVNALLVLLTLISTWVLDRNFDNNASSLEQIHLINFISSLHDQCTSFIPLGS